MKQVLLLLALVPALAFAGWSYGQDGAGGANQLRPLDLPAGGPGGQEDDEDAPETISFFGSEYEGDAFFWCFAAYEF